MIEAQSWHLGDIEHAGRQDSAVTGNYLAVAINQDRDDETENLDALGDLPDLFLAVPARVGRIWLQRFDDTRFLNSNYDLSNVLEMSNVLAV